MIDVKYLKRLYRQNFVRVECNPDQYTCHTSIINEEEIDHIAKCHHLFLGASLVIRTGKLENMSIELLDEIEHKRYTVYFRDNDDKKLYYTLNFPKDSYSKFISFVKKSAMLNRNNYNTHSCVAWMSVDKIGNELKFNNGSGKNKPRSLKKVLRDTEADLAHKGVLVEANGPELV